MANSAQSEEQLNHLNELINYWLKFGNPLFVNQSINVDNVYVAGVRLVMWL